jgi:hypothetical protein
MERRTLTIGDWLWNIALYPLTYLAVSVVSTAIELTFGGTYPPTIQAAPSDAVGLFLGLMVWWGVPAFIASIGLVALGFRFALRSSHRAIAVAVPLAVYTAWLWWLQPIVFMAWPGIAVTVLAFLALGLATRTPRENAEAT